MASGRRLYELLSEQQEPFLLEVYLLENGFSSKSLKSQAVISCWPIDACRKLLGLEKQRYKSRTWGTMLIFVLPKIHHWKLIRKALNWDRKAFGIGRKKVFGRFPRLGGEEELDYKRYSKRMQELEQLSPVCCFENHFVKEKNPSPSRGNSEISEKPCSAFVSDICRYKESEKTLFKSKQLLLQCEKELERRNWDSVTSEVAGFADLTEVELSISASEWNHFQVEKRENVMEIERFIFGEITEELAVEMLLSHGSFEKG